VSTAVLARSLSSDRRVMPRLIGDIPDYCRVCCLAEQRLAITRRVAARSVWNISPKNAAHSPCSRESGSTKIPRRLISSPNASDSSRFA
jgi:hypothetical protein